MRHVVVVGHGMVGSRFTELLVEADPQVRVTVLGKEPVAAYNRVLLSSVVAEREPRSGWPRRRTRASRCSPASGPRRSTGTAGSSSTTGPRAPVRRPRPGDGLGRAGPPIQGVAYDEASSRACSSSRTWPTRPASSTPRSAGGRSSSAPACSAWRSPPAGEARPQRPHRPPRRPTHGAARLGGVAGRDLQPRAARHHDPRRGLRRGGQHPPRPAGEHPLRGRCRGGGRPSSSCAAAPWPRRCSPAGPASPSTAASSSPTIASPDDPHVHAIGDCAQPPSGATGLVAQGWQQAAALVATLAPGAVSPSAGPSTHDVVRVKASGMSMVSMGICGTSTATTPATACCRSRTPSVVATWRSSPPAATSSARRASGTRRSRRRCRRSTPARCRSPTTPRSSW